MLQSKDRAPVYALIRPDVYALHSTKAFAICTFAMIDLSLHFLGLARSAGQWMHPRFISPQAPHTEIQNSCFNLTVDPLSTKQ